MEVKEKDIIESFFIVGKHFYQTQKGYYEDNRIVGQQRYKDYKQLKNDRIEKGWDKKPEKWIN